MIFTKEPISEILSKLREVLKGQKKVSFLVLHPDLMLGSYAGTIVKIGSKDYLYRSLRAWFELAELLECRMLVPQRVDAFHLQITFERLKEDSFHVVEEDQEEKYGSNSLFSSIHKMEEPTFYYYYVEALKHIKIAERTRILDLGINRGDEFSVIRDMVTPEQYQSMEFLGIDHSKSALQEARISFPEKNVSFHLCDIDRLNEYQLEHFDLLISIGTLQSSGIRFKPLLMYLVQHCLNKDNAALILGFPNSRWRDGEMIYGAKATHYNFNEMGVVLEDILFAKRYLQQKKYRVMITGKQYLFLSAVRIEIK
ncbi:MAG: class I SAM-dependent methyltransferase [Sulfurovum sp.]|nr:class I SAM-dependent methyltransferase [Sulfurovum sp.]